MVQVEALSNPVCLEGVPSPDGQQEGEHRVVHHVQGEHYQRQVLIKSLSK